MNFLMSLLIGLHLGGLRGFVLGNESACLFALFLGLACLVLTLGLELEGNCECLRHLSIERLSLERVSCLCSLNIDSFWLFIYLEVLLEG